MAFNEEKASREPTQLVSTCARLATPIVSRLNVGFSGDGLLIAFSSRRVVTSGERSRDPDVAVARSDFDARSCTNSFRLFSGEQKQLNKSPCWMF